MNDATKVIISSDIAKDFIFFGKKQEQGVRGGKHGTKRETEGDKEEIEDDTQRESVLPNEYCPLSPFFSLLS